MTDEIIKQVDKNALNALKQALAENDAGKQAVRTGTALRLVGESSKLEKMKFDNDLATKKHDLDVKKHELEVEKVQIQKELDAEKIKLQKELEEQRRIDAIHQRDAQEKLEELNRIHSDQQLMARLAVEALSGVVRTVGGFAALKYGLDYEEHKVVSGKFKDLVIRQLPNPFRKG
jgi:methyl coenzyme M reductase gamma subunit